jgi:hypothetical protein
MCYYAQVFYKDIKMIETSKLLYKRMTTEDLSLLFLTGDKIMFSTREQFEHWLFILNFPLIKPYIKLQNKSKAAISVWFDFPFSFVIRNSGGGKFDYRGQRVEEGHMIHTVFVDSYYPEYRLLVKATR